MKAHNGVHLISVHFSPRSLLFVALKKEQQIAQMKKQTKEKGQEIFADLKTLAKYLIWCSELISYPASSWDSIYLYVGQTRCYQPGLRLLCQLDEIDPTING